MRVIVLHSLAVSTESSRQQRASVVLVYFVPQLRYLRVVLNACSRCTAALTRQTSKT
jgi:hypothetical protein